MLKKFGLDRRVAAHWTMELVIVVAGVLIALSAQEWAQDRSKKLRAVAAEEAMALEIRNSLLANVELTRLDRCWDMQIEALQSAIVGGNGTAAGRIVQGGSFFGPGRLWADNAFQAALSAQVSEDLGAEKLKGYSQVYAMIRRNRWLQDQREQTIEHLGALTVPGVPSSPEITYSQLSALAQLRATKEGMREIGKLISLYASKDLSLTVSEPQYLAAPGRLENIKACNDQARVGQQLTAAILR
jgi:hypothetical protein